MASLLPIVDQSFVAAVKYRSLGNCVDVPHHHRELSLDHSLGAVVLRCRSSVI